MSIKFIAFVTCCFLFLSKNSYAWIEYINEGSSQDTYYSDSDAFEEPVVERERVVYQPRDEPREVFDDDTYYAHLPKKINAPGERTIVINPREHAWGAYAADGKLVRSGLATSGAKWCEDIGRPCRTQSGVFRISSLGDRDCYSKTFPVDSGGGAPMPYCMYFNGGQALHGSYHVVRKNVSHGCVRVSVQDAEWIRFEFARMGTKVVVQPY